ncbi:MAG: glycoside hydrolase family 3 protein [Alphaproteobacteria bacterium]|nr:glycoside hydrolase family 3 protein [Alphaproteobacteria bacterium]
MIDRRMFLASAGALAAAGAGAPASARQDPQSLETLVGRTLILGFLGDEPDAPGADQVEADLAEGRIGGVLFLRHNARTRDGVLGLARRFRAAAPQAWLSIDQEGGFVQRLTDEMGFTDIPKARELAAMGPIEARPIFAAAASELAEAGFNLNLAPVADLHQDGNAVIGRWDRAFGDAPAEVAAWCALFIEAMEAAGVACAIKHFPGHGRSSGDSHDGFVDLTETWSFEEVEPFARLIESDHAHLLMGGHLINRRLDPSGAPVTLSRPVLNGLLRRAMRYDGAVITDDLDMGAIRDHYSREEAITGSLAAGNDLLLISNSADADPDLPRRAVDWVGAAIERGDLTMDRLVDANARIDQLKSRLG